MYLREKLFDQFVFLTWFFRDSRGEWSFNVERGNWGESKVILRPEALPWKAGLDVAPHSPGKRLTG